MIKKAMILGAGFGKRINPLTLKCPKPLLKIGKETLLSNTLKFIKKLGIDEVIINTHHLSDQIINYIKNNKFEISIKIENEKDKILDTGGGILNSIHHFSDNPFLVINPDTLWNENYIKEFKLAEKIFFEGKKNKCLLLLVNKNKSFDLSFRGDFNIKNQLIDRENLNNLKFIYTGAQIVRPEIFNDISEKVFSINKVWDKLIKSRELIGIESNISFLHVSNLDVYEALIKKYLHVK